VEEADKAAREYVESLKTQDSSKESEETDENPEAEEDESEEEDSGEEEAEEDETEEEEPEEKAEDDEEETWQQRYKSLKGMYDKDVPRLNQELRELKSEVFERLGQLSAKPDNADNPDVNADVMPENIKAFVEDMGEDYIANLNSYMEYMFGPMLDKGLQPVADKVSDVEDATVKSAQKQFSDYLDTKVEGDWQSLMSGEDETFLEFLQTPDPSGLYTYGELIKLYNDNWDADKLATVLNTYMGADGGTGDEEAVKKSATKKAKKDTTVAPNRKKHSSTPEANDARIWTQADIKQFEKDDRMNKYDDEESKAMWRDLMAAGIEGRIRD